MNKLIILILAFSSFVVYGCTNDAVITNDITTVTKYDAIAAPDFTLKEMGGDMVTLSDYKNSKPVVLIFWATWCGYCRQEVPKINALRSIYSEEDLAVLSINLQESEDVASKYAKSLELNYQVLMDFSGKVANKYGVRGVPTMFLIDVKGNVVTQSHTMSPQLNSLIRDAVNKAE